MAHGFPLALLPLIACTKDGGRFRPKDGGPGDRVTDGMVACQACGAEREVREGILDLLDPAAIADERSRFELRSRDDEARRLVTYATDRETLEVPSTLRRLGDLGGKTVLEIGCGTGQYTRSLARTCASLVALDFSWESLRVNAAQLHEGSPRAQVGFVRADVGQVRFAPGVFHAALSTLYSNLPTPELRAQCNRTARDALAPGARYVVSCHHQDWYRRRAGLPAETRYSTGVFAEYFTRASFRRELAQVFDHVAVVGITTHVPYVSRIERARPLVSRLAERIPLLDELAQILLAVAVKEA